MRFIRILVIFLLAPLFAQAADRHNMRHYRYCEILLNQSFTQFAVYNTVGLNQCPEATWKNITPESIKKQTHARIVHLNGPRYFVFDGFENTALINREVKTLGGLPMRLAGILTISLRDLLKEKLYTEHKVDRQTVWIYVTGKPVYELIDPHQNVFVMQSYSIQKHMQTENSLAQLGSVLQLPKGWSFKTGVLTQMKKLKANNNQAIVIQDDFLNTYQKADHDFLAK